MSDTGERNGAQTTGPETAGGFRLPSARTQIQGALVVLVGIAALVALASQLLGGWEKSAETLAGADRGWLSISFLFTLAYLVGGEAGWWLQMRAFGYPLGFLDGFRLFFVSGLVRYLPGRVWYTVTRVYMAGQVGIPAAVTSVSLIVEILLVLASGALVAGLAIPLILADSNLLAGIPVVGGNSGLVLLLGVLVLVGGLVALHPIVLRPSILIFARLLRRPLAEAPELQYRVILGLVAWYCFDWMLASASLWALLISIHPVGLDSFATVSAAYAVSFLLGFVNPVMPAGLGVREGALVLLLQWVVPVGIAAAASVLFRVWVTLGEAVIVLVAAALQVRWLRRRARAGGPAGTPAVVGGPPVGAAPGGRR